MEPVIIQIEPGEPPCAICLESDTDREWIQLECSDRYHRECIQQWFRDKWITTCPICLRGVTPSRQNLRNCNLCCGVLIFTIVGLLLDEYFIK